MTDKKRVIKNQLFIFLFKSSELWNFPIKQKHGWTRLLNRQFLFLFMEDIFNLKFRLINYKVLNIPARNAVHFLIAYHTWWWQLTIVSLYFKTRINRISHQNTAPWPTNARNRRKEKQNTNSIVESWHKFKIVNC